MSKLERLLVTVDATDVVGGFEIFARQPSKDFVKRIFGFRDYIPLQITALKVNEQVTEKEYQALRSEGVLHEEAQSKENQQ